MMAEVNPPQHQRMLDEMVCWALSNGFRGIVDICNHKHQFAMHKIDDYYKRVSEIV
jgi:hypothetical protein